MCPLVDMFHVHVSVVFLQPDLLKKLVKQLESSKFVTDQLSLGDSKYMVSQDLCDGKINSVFAKLHRLLPMLVA